MQGIGWWIWWPKSFPDNNQLFLLRIFVIYLSMCHIFWNKNVSWIDE